MAIDTAAKRHSALGYSGGPPQPDSSVDLADRQTVLAVYGGIAAGAVSSLAERVWAYVFRQPLPSATVSRQPLPSGKVSL